MVEESGNTKSAVDRKSDGNQPIGSLEIKSVPIEMTISIPALDFNYGKKKTDLRFSNIPAGAYSIIFSGSGKKISSQVTIHDKVTTEIFVHLLKDEVQNKTELERKRAEEERKIALIRAEEQKVIAEAAFKDLGKNFTIPDLNLDMLWVEPGTFTMGSPTSEEGRSNDETQHQVTLSKGFYLGKYEVTQAQWERVMGSNPSRFKGADRPVENVWWKEVTGFCEKLTELEKKAERLPAGMAYQLPTEAEWEYACRAGTTKAYSQGYIADTNANYRESEIGQTASVGSYSANPWGFYDMHGNVWEWCADRYQAIYPSGSVTDPSGLSSGPTRVVRGGSWFFPGTDLRSAKRNYYTPGYRTGGLGFRVGFKAVP